ncbi:MAG: hypothetical protein IKM30_06025 [Oscillospiraceae bacterium]|nr:hypothetical protein [Oscillospiraceae bacterium]
MTHLSLRRIAAAACFAMTLLLSCGCDSQDSVILPQTNSSSSADSKPNNSLTDQTNPSSTTTASQVTTTGTTTTTATSSQNTSATMITEVSTSTSATTETTQQQTDNTCLFDTLYLGMDCTAYVAEHTNYTLQEAASCMGSGLDRVYTYPGYRIYSYFNGTTDEIIEINLIGTDYKTRLGATIGMTKAEIESIYGPSETYSYQTSDGIVEFLFEGDTVQLIAVYYIM